MAERQQIFGVDAKRFALGIWVGLALIIAAGGIYLLFATPWSDEGGPVIQRTEEPKGESNGVQWWPVDTPIGTCVIFDHFEQGFDVECEER